MGVHRRFALVQSQLRSVASWQRTPTVVQTGSNATASASSIAASFGANVAPGNLIIVCAGIGTANNGQATCAGGSQTWHKLYGSNHSGANDIVVGFWTIATSAFTGPITVSWPVSNFTGIEIVEISGMGRTPHFYGACLTNVLTSPTMYVPTQCVAFFHVYQSGGSGAFSNPAGWSSVGGGSGWNALFYKITTSSADINVVVPNNGGSGMSNFIFAVAPS